MGIKFFGCMEVKQCYNLLYRKVVFIVMQLTMILRR
uniref:Uncharacterized protein n=1 Tax=Rhizophora mucronata TaxID=61149 RepID=A0A2P2NCX2_RHIMU